jgi:antitoxin (DNA-binding transcriptional repressor) of toxin-antitoxin stability system
MCSAIFEKNNKKYFFEKSLYLCTELVQIKKPQFMLVISTREFRDKQKSYLDKVDGGMEILIRRAKEKSYKIVPVTKDDTLMSKEEYFARLERGLQSIKEGRGREYTLEEIDQLLGL